MGFPGGSDGKESTCNAEDPGSVLELGRSPGGGHGSPLQCSCLENPTDRGAWLDHGVAELDTTDQLSTLWLCFTLSLIRDLSSKLCIQRYECPLTSAQLSPAAAAGASSAPFRPVLFSFPKASSVARRSSRNSVSPLQIFGDFPFPFFHCGQRRSSV